MALMENHDHNSNRNRTRNRTRNSNDMTLVLGGTGKTGRRVAERLRALGRPSRLGSRAGEPRFDWDDDTSWSAVLANVEAVYLAYYPDVAFPGAADKIRSFADAAVGNGARRIVMLSGRGEEHALPSEQAVRESGADWTVLRASWFAQNFSEHFLLEPVLDGVIALPAGDMAEPFVDAEDLADVAMAALTQEGHAGSTYELTGPRLMTFADIADELTRATGRSVRYLSVSPEEYAAAAVEHGVPIEEVGPLTDLFTRVLDGRNAFVTHDVERILGRPARDFANYAQVTAASGVWAVPTALETLR